MAITEYIQNSLDMTLPLMGVGQNGNSLPPTMDQTIMGSTPIKYPIDVLFMRTSLESVVVHIRGCYKFDPHQAPHRCPPCKGIF